MKISKLISSCLVACTMIVVSCAKKDNADIAPSSISISTHKVNLELIKEINNSSQPIIRLALEKLSPEEKVVLWKTHLDAYLNDPGISPALKIHIAKLEPLLNVAFFKNANTLESKIFIDKFTKEWYTDPVSKGQFKNNELLEVATVYGLGSSPLQAIRLQKRKVSNPGIIANGTGLVASGTCDCYYSMSCSGTNTCQSNGCSKGGSCGIFGSSNCTGTCS